MATPRPIPDIIRDLAVMACEGHREALDAIEAVLVAETAYRENGIANDHIEDYLEHLPRAPSYLREERARLESLVREAIR